MSDHYNSYLKEFNHSTGLTKIIRSLERKLKLAKTRIKKLELQLEKEKTKQEETPNDTI